MKIRNIDGLSANDIQEQVDKGARFLYYAFTISLIFVTFRRTSGVYLVRNDESAATRGIPFSIISFLFGWWGFPYGPLYTMESIRTNFKGGKDVTDDVMATVAGYMLFEETQERKKSGQA